MGNIPGGAEDGVWQTREKLVGLVAAHLAADVDVG
jgi:hypothetical protein